MRLIDVDALKEKAFSDPDTTMSGEALVYVQDIDEAPTVDAVPVVRCRDCKHWDKFVGEEHRGFCFAWKVDSYDEDFCSYGERKENNND